MRTLKISNELKIKIENLFQDNEKLKKDLLSGNPNAIQKIAIIGDDKIAPEDVIIAYESNDMENIYQEAQKKLAIKKLYKELCEAYWKETADER